jgi:hypothetical protein
MGTLHVSDRVLSLIHIHDRALPALLFRRISAGVRALGGERLRSTFQTTFWYDFGRPSSVIEQGVISLRSLLPERRLAGVEWWLSRMRTNRVGVDFHRDRDEMLVTRKGLVRHPAFSSVLFLNRVRGGALAVTRQSPNPRNPCSVPSPLEADLTSPRPNRLVWFDGRLTHGVLDGDNQVPVRERRSSGELRLSVVMNWWTRAPVGVPTFLERGVYSRLAVALGRQRGRV